MSQFSFLKPEFPAIYESAHKAFRTAYRDPRTACFYARRALELTVNWLYKYDTSLRLPYQDNLSALVHEPTFKTLVGEAVFNKAKYIIRLGNLAVHNERAVPANDAINAVREFFHVAYWLAHTYGRTHKPEAGLQFDPQAIPQASTSLSQREKSGSVSEVELSRTELQKLEKELSDRDEKLSILLADKNAIDEELKRLRAELIAVKQANTVQPDTHDYSEAQTRDLFIDLLLKESGWDLASAPMASTPLSHRQKPSSLSEVEGTVNAAGNVEGRQGTTTAAKDASGVLASTPLSQRRKSSSLSASPERSRREVEGTVNAAGNVAERQGTTTAAKDASGVLASTPLSQRRKSSSLSASPERSRREVEGTVNEAEKFEGQEGTANITREFQVSGMPNESGKGYVDYVLWGDDGKPLALVEAKRTKKAPRIGQQQAKLYADCLEAQFGQRPIIFYTNGYEHYIWDDTNYPPRQVQGFYKKSELELLIQRRTTQKPLSTANINPAIASRHYQARAIRKVSEAFEQNKERKVLIIMATGAGKTRTAIALVDLLMRCNWVKRALFLADRISLVNQAINVFKKHLPDSAPVNLLTEKDTEGRVYASTYATMMGLINGTTDNNKNGQKRFGVGHFDLIIIDEAHRSVYQKYRHIFNYFDCLLLGLTATPKDEIDRNTYSLFDLENGVPTDAYQLEDAVKDGYLVPTKAISVPLKFQREGIKYDELSEAEKEEWDALEWDEEGNIPDRIEAGALDQWLFNQDTADKVLEHLMTRGLKVAGGDRLGKTIIFAKNQKHAEFIEDRFNANYPHLKGEFTRLITNRTPYAQSLIDEFSKKDKDPHIAISVDMLDTGIDVPEVVNLVLFKLVRSKTKFWQMVGRGTLLCPDLFGDGQDKQFFYLFDYCQNLEFFKQNIPTIDAPIPKSLGKQLFTTRLDLIAALDKKYSSLSEVEGTTNAAEDASGVLASASLSQRIPSSSLSEVEGTTNEAGNSSEVLASASLSQRIPSSSLSEVEGTTNEAGNSSEVLASASLSQRIPSSSLSEVEGTANAAGNSSEVLASASLSQRIPSSSLSEVEGTTNAAGNSSEVLASTSLSQRIPSSSLSEVEGTTNAAGNSSEVLASASLSQRIPSSSLSEVEGTTNEAGNSSEVLASTSLSQQSFSLSQRRASRSLSIAEGNEMLYNPTTNPESSLRNQIAQVLYSEVAAMNCENFIVRPKRRLVEKYNNLEVWRSLSEQDLTELSQEIAGLPAQIEPEAEEIKRFDILILKLQLAILRSHSSFTRLRDQVKAIANLLEQKASIPLVQAQLALIQDIQTDEWWQDITLPMLEAVRKRLRSLVKLIEKQERQPIYTNFEDEMGDETIVELPHFTPSDNFEKFRAKARDFLRSHQDHLVIFKLRNNKQLTTNDLSELETILIENGLGNTEDLDRAKQESHGLGLFVRSLIGLDREVAKQEFGKFLTDKTLSANQIEFINMIVDYLTEHGAIAAERLYESPFTDFAPQGIDSLFASSQVDELCALLDDVSAKAAA